MTPEHDELTLAAGHALGSLDPAERDAFVAHLQTCAECQKEVRSLHPVAAALAAAVPSRTPRPELRERVLSAVLGDAYVVSGFSRTEDAAAHPEDVVSGLSRTEDAASHPEDVVSGLSRTEGRETGEPYVVSGFSRTTGPRAVLRAWTRPSVWLPAAALILVSVGLGLHSRALQRQIDALETRLDVALRDADSSRLAASDAQGTAVRLQHAMAVLASSDMARIELVGQPAAPSASARAFWSRNRGLVFTAKDLPALPPGRVYQVWVLTSGAPISAGLVSPDGAGGATAVLATSPDIPPPAGVAVSLEPAGGVPSPTGAIYLAGKPSA